MISIEEIFVPGKPQGKGRPRLTTAGGYAHAYTPASTVKYETLINNTFKNKYPNFRYDEEDYLRIDIIAQMPIPKSFNKKKRQEALDNIIRPATRTSDVDNICKSVLDGLQGDKYQGPIPDDKQVVELNIIKIYSENPGVQITINKIN